MELPTLSALKTIVKNELDLNSEVFISDAELTSYFAKAVDRAEQEIIKINEDYFLTKTTLSVVSGTASYSLPSDIYARKIKGLLYNDGTNIYPIRRFRGLDPSIDKQYLDTFGGTNTDYAYRVENVFTSATSIAQKIFISPTPQETTSTAFIVEYLRNANHMTSDSHICDIPEGINMILSHVKMQCLQKEFGGVAPQEAIAEVDREVSLMVATLTEAYADDDNEVIQDNSHYMDHV